MALQLASQQLSPRLLRELSRDRVVQLTMGLLVSAFVVSLTTLRGLDPERPLPVLAPGFRQLVDIAVKAISPGINDPTTAAEALGSCADSTWCALRRGASAVRSRRC